VFARTSQSRGRTQLRATIRTLLETDRFPVLGRNSFNANKDSLHCPLATGNARLLPRLEQLLLVGGQRRKDELKLAHQARKKCQKGEKWKKWKKCALFFFFFSFLFLFSFSFFPPLLSSS